MPVGLVLTATIRLAGSRGRLGAVLVAAAALAAVIATPAVAGLRLTGWPQDRGWGPVTLDWTIENRSSEPLTLGVWDPAPDGYGGWTVGIAPCFISTGTTDAASDWYLSVQRGTEAEVWDAEPIPLISSGDVGGLHAQVWVEVAPDGSMTAIPGRPHPEAHALTVDRCAGGVGR
jgi:hypothetical protein